MATTVNRSVNIYIQSGEAEKAYDRLIKKEQQLNKELAAATDPKKIKDLTAELNKLQEPIDRAGRKLRGELAPSFRDVQNTVNALGRRLRQLSEQDADYSKILVQYNAANVALKEQKRNIDQLSNATKDAGIGSFLGTFAGNLAFQALNFLRQAGRDALQWALETEGVRNAFSRLNQPGLLDNLRKATKGTVSDLDLMKRAVAANNFQIPLERLGTLLEFAQRRARETGQSVDYLVDSIVTGIARKSPLILDNLGINIARINDQFKQTGDFAQAAFNVVEEELSKAGPALETFSDIVDRWSASFKNIATQTGEGLISGGYNIYSSLIKQFGSLEAQVEVYARDANQAIAKENIAARDRELVQIEDHKRRLAAADKNGREALVREAKRQIHDLEIQESLYRLNSQERDAQLVFQRLDVWKNYFSQLNKLADGNDTIANLQKEITTTTEIRDNAIIGSEQYNQAVFRLKSLQERLDKLLGRNKAKEKESLYTRFKQQLDEMAREIDAFNAAQIDKDLLASNIKFDRVREDLKKAFNERRITEEQLGDFLIMNEDTRGRDQANILHKWAEESNKQRLELEKKNQQKLRELEAKRLQDLLAFQETLAKNAAEMADKAMGRRRYQLEVDELLATGRQKIDIRIQQLELERDAEIAAAEKTGKDVTDINRKYAKLIHDERLKGFQGLIGEIAAYMSAVNTALTAFFDMQSEKDQQQLEQDRIVNDKKKDNYKHQLEGKRISQSEYDKKVQQLDRQQEERERQARVREFNRNKISKLVNATINVAEQVASVIANPILATIVALAGAFQIGIIASSKPPKFGKGGRLEGPLHSQGGMPVIDPRSGRKVAELEGEEVILSRNTYKNNRSLVDQLLHSSMYKNGEPINPQWKNYNQSNLNIPVISDSINRVRMFEKGGIMPATSSPNDSALMVDVLMQLKGTVENFSAQVASGIYAYTSLTEHNRQQERLDNIQIDATMH